MIANTTVKSIFVSLFLISLIGIAGAENMSVNGTNVSESVNLSVNMTEHDYMNQTGENMSGMTNATGDTVSTGGIKNFMKSFKYQSQV